MTKPSLRVWFFDLDDTLHDASHGIFREIDLRMTEFVMRHLRLDARQADALRRDYWARYGATMLGLIRHHAVDIKQFLRVTHEFDLEALLRSERGLAPMLARLAGRKVLLTNAPADYARRVVRGIGLHRHLHEHYPIERMRVHGAFRPKPSVAMLRVMLAREGLARTGGRRAVLVDDNMGNLKAARAAGFATVLLVRRRRGAAPRRLAGAHYIDARVHSLHELPSIGRRIGRRAPANR